MPVVISAESEYGKELAKWNKPYRFEPFPQMLYKAKKRDDGVVVVGDGENEILARECYLIVQSEGERQRAFEAGWREKPDEALALFEAKERHIADTAAHRAYEDRNMSEPAQAEAVAADAATIEHVPEVPEAPRRRGRPPNKAIA